MRPEFVLIRSKRNLLLMTSFLLLLSNVSVTGVPDR
jgi:hypothetical protein